MNVWQKVNSEMGYTEAIDRGLKEIVAKCFNDAANA